MSRPRIVSAILLATFAGGCGGLSNDDLLFRAVLPDQSITVSLPVPDEPVATPPEGSWAMETSLALMAASRLNAMVNEVLIVMYGVTAQAAIVRETGQEEWSAVSVPSTQLFARMTMSVATQVQCDTPSDPLPANAPQYRWTISMSRDASQGFVPVFEGLSRGSILSHSCGTILADLVTARDLGVSVGDRVIDPVETFFESWQRSGADTALRMTERNDLSLNDFLSPQSVSLFQQRADGSGLFQFGTSSDVRGQGVENMETTLQWAPQGHPWRADFCVASTPSVCGTACGPDPGSRTYLSDDESGAAHQGTPAVCGSLPATTADLTPSE